MAMYRRPYRVLLVEDNPADVRLLQEAFRESRDSHEIHIVEDGHEALDFMYRRFGYTDKPRPDLILLDINLPKLDGYAVLDAVKSKVTVNEVLPDEIHATQSVIATFLINVFAEAENGLHHEPLLIVLDGIHHLFDAEWFGEFFTLLLPSLPENINLLLLCRSKPPNPLWRLRSKQQLNVIDEKVLVFNLAETVQLAKRAGLEPDVAEREHAATFGRISKLLQRIGRASGAI